MHIRYFIGYVYHVCLQDTIQSTLSLCLRCQAMLLPMPLRPLLLTTRSGFTVWLPRRGGPWSHLCIGGMTRCWSPASTRRMSSWRGSWITSRTNMMVRLGRTRRHGIFQEWVPTTTKTRPTPQISEDYRWEELPTTMKTAYRTRRSQTWTQQRPIPQCGRLCRYRSKRLRRPRRTRRSPS